MCNSNRSVIQIILGIEIVLLVAFTIVKSITTYILPIFFEMVTKLQMKAPSTIWEDLFVYEAIMHVAIITFLFFKVRDADKKARVRANSENCAM